MMQTFPLEGMRRLSILAVALSALGAGPALAVVQSEDFSFSSEILGGDNPGYVVNSSVNFSWDDACSGSVGSFCTLTITLTADPSAGGAMPSQGEVLTGLLFDALGSASFRDGPPGSAPFGGTVTASALEGSGAATALGEIGLDVSGHWGLNPALAIDGWGEIGLSSTGDVLNGAGTVGNVHILPGPTSSVEDPLNGSPFGIIDSGSSSGGSGWPSGDLAYVQDTITADLLYTGVLSGVDEVTPFYGTMGLPVPEPGTAALFALGLVGLGLAGRSRPRGR